MVKYQKNKMIIELEGDAAMHQFLINGIAKGIRLIACCNDRDRRKDDLCESVSVLTDLLIALSPDEFGLEKATPIVE